MKRRVPSLSNSLFTSRIPVCLSWLALGLVGSMLLSGCASSVKVPVVPDRTHLPTFQPSEITLTPIQEQTLGLQIESVQRRTLPIILQTTGQVQAVNNLMAHSYAPVAGTVLEVPFSVGTSIRQGQVLARIKSDQIGQLQADLLQQSLQTEADIRQAKVQLQLSQATYHRESNLFAQKVSPRADMEAAKAQYEKDQGAILALKSKLQSLITSYQSRLSLYGAAPNIAQQVVRQRKIFPFITLLAPKSGLLIARNVNQGELVDTTKELFTLADLSKVWLVGDIYENDISKVRLNLPVQVRLDGMPDHLFRGRVSFMDAMLDPQARTLEIRSEVSNPNLVLKPNMFARVAIDTGEKQAIAVPNPAIQRNGDFMYVYLPLGNHHYLERKIKTGMSTGEYTEVTDGLQAGDTVVTQGSLALKGEILKQQARGE